MSRINFHKKGQAAVETLMIYGVTILIVMLAIGALIGFGIIDFGNFFPDKCKLPSVLDCKSHLVTSDKVQLQLENIHGRNIAEMNITIHGEKDNEGLWNCEYSNYATTLVVGDVSNIIDIPCVIDVPVGKKISGVITVKYRETGLQLAPTIRGELRATVSE